MPKYTGEDMVLKFGGTDISGASRALEVTEEVTELDTTTYGSTDREYLLTKERNRTGSFTIIDDAGSTATENIIETGSTGTLEWAPEGTAVGKRKRSAVCLILRNRKSFPHDDLTQFAVDFRLSGSVTKGTY